MIEVTANNQQVLAVPAQTAKPLQQHIPTDSPVVRRICIPYDMEIPVQGYLIERFSLAETAHGPFE